MNIAPVQALPWIRHCEYRDEVGSTSDLALQLAADRDLKTPAVVVARRQTAGRGRGTNRWWSGEGALSFSLVLAPEDAGVPVAHWPRLALTTAVAVCDAARPLAPRPAWGIKWPNDLFAAGRKIAGVLVEAPNLPGLARRRAVIGVGLNVNNSMALAPAQLRSSGVALCDLTHQSHDLVRLLADVLGSIERRLAQLGDEDPRLAIAWRELCILRGRAVRVAPPEPATVGDSAQSEVMDGICHGIDDDGSLLVQGADGPRRIVAGRVTIME